MILPTSVLSYISPVAKSVPLDADGAVKIKQNVK
jgi:hypothetical protein